MAVRGRSAPSRAPMSGRSLDRCLGVHWRLVSHLSKFLTGECVQILERGIKIKVFHHLVKYFFNLVI